MTHPMPCPVCGELALFHDSVDFHKSCEDANGPIFPPSGLLIDYFLCPKCHFCFAPQIMSWPMEAFENKIYNEDYALVDPDYLKQRPKGNASRLLTLFGARAYSIRHLDYGGGNGLLSEILKGAGWNSASYDPMVNKDTPIKQLGKYNLITAFEVFEHVPDVSALFAHLCSLRASNGVIFFTTYLSDQDIHPGEKLTWWYASPRNGHISLFSKASLKTLARKHGLSLHSYSSDVHVLYAKLPSWAANLKL